VNPLVDSQNVLCRRKNRVSGTQYAHWVNVVGQTETHMPVSSTWTPSAVEGVCFCERPEEVW